MLKLTFQKMELPVLAMCNQKDGLLYLEIVGIEQLVNAVTAALLSSEARGDDNKSRVKVNDSGIYGNTIFLEKHTRYRQRKEMIDGLLNLVLIHPKLTKAEDSIDNGFFITVSKDDQLPPPEFFSRLNRCLEIPLKPEWTEWLWSAGRSRNLIYPLSTCQGDLDIYKIDTNSIVGKYEKESYRDKWLEIIRSKANLSVKLEQIRPELFLNSHYRIEVVEHTFKWFMEGEPEPICQAQSLEELGALTKQKGIKFEVTRFLN